MAETRPPEELYNLADDPWELNNLARKDAQKKRLIAFRGLLHDWEQQSGDQGQQFESMDRYDSDMKPYLDRTGRRDPAKAKVLEDNISLMKQWQRDGK